MSNFVFNKFEKDIFNAYENLFGKVNKLSNEEISKCTEICNKILFDICHSYYMRDQYKNTKLLQSADINNNKFYYVASTYQNEEDKSNYNHYLIKGGILLNEIENNSDFFSRKFADVFDATNEYNKVIELLKKEKYYNILLEDNLIKRQLNLKKKDDLQLSIINNDISINYFKSILSNQNIENEEQLKIYLKTNCGIDFIDLDSQKNYTWFIYHNEDDIAAIGTIKNNNLMKNIQDNKEMFKYLSFITVNYGFRGKSLGTKIYEEIIDYCIDNNFILEISDFTNEGSLYLKKNFEIINNNNIHKLPIIKKEYYPEIESFIIKNSKSNNYNEIRNKLINTINNLKEVEKEKGKLLKSDLKKLFNLSRVKLKI